MIAVAELTEAELSRYWGRVTKTPGCWRWDGYVKPNGYGLFRPKRKAQWHAHRFSWELTNGPIPKGMYVCHTCDTPSCVRPDHLFLGTQTDNMADMKAKGRAKYGVYQREKTHCRNGHPFSPANTKHYVRDGTPRRSCRTCCVLSQRRRNAATRVTRPRKPLPMDRAEG